MPYYADEDKLPEYWGSSGLSRPSDPIRRADANIDLFLHQVAIGADVINTELYNLEGLRSGTGMQGWQDSVDYGPYAVARGEAKGLPPMRLYSMFCRVDQEKPGSAVFEILQNADGEPKLMHRFAVHATNTGSLAVQASTANMLLYSGVPAMKRRVKKLDTLASLFDKWNVDVIPAEVAAHANAKDAIRRRAEELNMIAANGGRVPRFASRSPVPLFYRRQLTAA